VADPAGATVHVESSVADYAAAQRVLRRRKLAASQWLWSLPAVILAILVMVLVERSLGSFPGLPEWAHPFISVPLAAAFYFRASHYLNRYRFKALLDPKGPFLAPTDYRLAPDGLHWQNHRGEGRIAWHAVLQVEETATHIFLFVDRAMAHVLPKRCFGSDAKAADFFVLARHFADSARTKAA
jgi:hypothetical protein